MFLLSPTTAIQMNESTTPEGQTGERESKTPNRGTPVSVHVNPGSGQERLYGDDGLPVLDVDYDHDHGQGVPHDHEWTRDADGNPIRLPSNPKPTPPPPEPNPARL
jgi:hypothetical protein